MSGWDRVGVGRSWRWVYFNRAVGWLFYEYMVQLIQEYGLTMGTG